MDKEVIYVTILVLVDSVLQYEESIKNKQRRKRVAILVLVDSVLQ